MISIIVPVYNVEKYVRKCLDSVVGQTYEDLEILIVDDGSIDGSGAICDEYATLDERIKVFHTGNRGLSAARNLGLDNAHGEWIGFVDSDDWIEPDMYEFLLKRAKETGVDIVECGVSRDYPRKSIKCRANNSILSGKDAEIALIKDYIRTSVWNKIYRNFLFDNIRFPEGRDFEDILTTHKILSNRTITGVEGLSYHYTQRNSSISQNHDIKNLIDYWTAHKQRFEDLKGIVDEASLLQCCASAIGRVWVWYWKSDSVPDFSHELSSFANEHFPLFGFNNWPLYLRVTTFLSRFDNELSFFIAYYLNQVYRMIKTDGYV